MEHVRECAYALCAISIVGSVYTLLAPKCGKRVISLIIGLIFLISAVSAVKRADISSIFNSDGNQNSIYNQEIMERAEKIYEKTAAENIKEVINQQLNRIDIRADRINIKIKTEENYNINIEEVTVLLSDKYKSREYEVGKIFDDLKIKGNIKWRAENETG